MSTSDRRSGSSGPSKKRERVFISTSLRDRARDAERVAGAPVPPRKGRQPARVVGPKSGRPASGKPRADELKAARERRLRDAQRSVRMRTLLIAAAVLAVLGGCVALYVSPLFTLTSVDVVGNVHMTDAQVLALAAVPKSATLIRFPDSAVAERLSQSPWVLGVSVSRVFPSGMRIRITERKPIALVDAGQTMWLMDGTGMIIAKPTTETSETIPVVRDIPGLDLKAGRRTVSEPLLNVVKLLTGLDSRISETVASVSAPTIEETVLVRRDRIELVVGEATDLATKSALILQILADQPGKVVSIDVRVTDRPTWRGVK